MADHPLDIYPKVLLLGLEESCFSIFWEISLKISKWVVPVYTPTPKTLKHKFSSMFLILAILTGIRWNLRVVFPINNLVTFLLSVEADLTYLLLQWQTSVKFVRMVITVSSLARVLSSIAEIFMCFMVCRPLCYMSETPPDSRAFIYKICLYGLMYFVKGFLYRHNLCFILYLELNCCLEIFPWILLYFNLLINNCLSLDSLKSYPG